MEDALWNKAKQIAQSKGRREDWVFIVGVYRSLGGTDMKVSIYDNGRKLQILGEVDEGKILVLNAESGEETIDRTLYTRSRKRFEKGGKKP